MTMSVGMLERDAEIRRQRLSQSLDELTGRLTPGSVVDEILSYTRAGGGDFLKGLGKSAAANPIPTMLISAGCLMFLTGRTGLSGTTATGDNASGSAGLLASIQRGLGGAVHALGGATGAVRNQASSVAEGAWHGAEQAGAAAAKATDSVARGVSGLAHSAADAVESAAGRISESASSVSSAAGSYAGAVTDTVAAAGARAEQAGYDAAQGIARLAREQPLMVAAAGLALGAAIAALLPKTEIEDSMMGETSDAVKRSVGEVAAEGASAASDAFDKVASKVARAADDAGLSPSLAAQGVESLGTKVANVANAGLDAAREEADRLIRQ